MKRIIVALLLVFAVFAFSACADTSNDGTLDTNPNNGITDNNGSGTDSNNGNGTNDLNNNNDTMNNNGTNGTNGTTGTDNNGGINAPGDGVDDNANDVNRNVNGGNQ